MILKYGDMLYRLCLIMLKQESDAEDAVQETFIKYLRKAPVFENSEHEKAWMIRVAKNQCCDMIRFCIRHPQIEENAIEQMECDLQDTGILEALMCVPHKYRLVLTLYYIEDYRIEDIAKIIQRTPSAVKMRLQKGRKLLKEIYRKEYL